MPLRHLQRHKISLIGNTMSEYIKLKMMALVVPTRFWVIILPRSIVDGYPHFLRIAMIKIILRLSYIHQRNSSGDTRHTDNDRDDSSRGCCMSLPTDIHTPVDRPLVVVGRARNK